MLIAFDVQILHSTQDASKNVTQVVHYALPLFIIFSDSQRVEIAHIPYQCSQITYNDRAQLITSCDARKHCGFVMHHNRRKGMLL